jgi:hypothetical protein
MLDLLNRWQSEGSLDERCLPWWFWVFLAKRGPRNFLFCPLLSPFSLFRHWLYISLSVVTVQVAYAYPAGLSCSC